MEEHIHICLFAHICISHLRKKYKKQVRQAAFKERDIKRLGQSVGERLDNLLYLLYQNMWMYCLFNVFYLLYLLKQVYRVFWKKQPTYNTSSRVNTFAWMTTLQASTSPWPTSWGWQLSGQSSMATGWHIRVHNYTIAVSPNMKHTPTDSKTNEQRDPCFHCSPPPWKAGVTQMGTRFKSKKPSWSGRRDAAMHVDPGLATRLWEPERTSGVYLQPSLGRGWRKTSTTHTPHCRNTCHAWDRSRYYRLFAYLCLKVSSLHSLEHSHSLVWIAIHRSHSR